MKKILLTLLVFTFLFAFYRAVTLLMNENSIEQPAVEFVTSQGTHLEVTEFTKDGKLYDVDIRTKDVGYKFRLEPPNFHAWIRAGILSPKDLRDIAEVVERYEVK